MEICLCSAIDGSLLDRSRVVYCTSFFSFVISVLPESNCVPLLIVVFVPVYAGCGVRIVAWALVYRESYH